MLTGKIAVEVTYKPMTLTEYNLLMDLDAPVEEAEGFLVRSANSEIVWLSVADFKLEADPVPIPPIEPTPQPTENLVFGLALEMLKLGHKVTRTGAEDAIVDMQASGGNSSPYLRVTMFGLSEPYTPSHTAMLANDWKIVE